jgi:hypothetical protein
MLTDTLCCPSCARALLIPGDLVGHEVKCPSCGVTFAASLAEPEPAPPPRPAPAPPRPAPTPPPRRSDDRERRWARWREKPARVQTLGVLHLVGGVLALVVAAGWMATCVGFFWPGTYYSLVLGVLAVVKGSQLLGERADRDGSPQAVCVMQVVNVINLDVINLTLGIVGLIFVNEPDVRAYFRA